MNSCSALESIVWDAHSCLPIASGIDFDCLAAHRLAGFQHVAINIAMDMTPLADTLRAIAWFRHSIAQSESYLQAYTVDDVAHAAKNGQLAVSFDIEGAMCLCGEASMVQLYADLGVRMMHLAYNLDNVYAGGCHGTNTGLTPLGQEVVRAANHAGVVMDCSHSSERSSLEIIAASHKPVVFSHANVHRLVPDTPRNITDAQIRACAESDGVVGICGFNLFLGHFPASAVHMAEHIDYIAQRFGIAHVGIGWDYAYPGDGVPLAATREEYEKYFIDGVRSDEMIDDQAQAYVPLDQREAIAAALRQRGYTEGDIRLVMGGNFLRVAQACWPAKHPSGPRSE